MNKNQASGEAVSATFWNEESGVDYSRSSYATKDNKFITNNGFDVLSFQTITKELTMIDND